MLYYFRAIFASKYPELFINLKLPSNLHVNTAGLPKSIVCTLGSMVALSGAVTVSTVSTLSPPTELLTTQRYFPESSTLASLIIKVPATCLTRSLRATACFREVPSMNLYHLQQQKVLLIK